MEKSYDLVPTWQASEARRSHAGNEPQLYGTVKGTLKLAVPYLRGYRSDPHFYFFLDAGGGREEKVDVNTWSSDGSEVLFTANPYFGHSIVKEIKMESSGFDDAVPGLDYWREHASGPRAGIRFLPEKVALRP